MGIDLMDVLRVIAAALFGFGIALEIYCIRGWMRASRELSALKRRDIAAALRAERSRLESELVCCGPAVDDSAFLRSLGIEP